MLTARPPGGRARPPCRRGPDAAPASTAGGCRRVRLTALVGVLRLLERDGGAIQARTERGRVARWLRCAQCGRRYWAGDFYKPVSAPPRLPGESVIRYVRRKWLSVPRLVAMVDSVFGRGSLSTTTLPPASLRVCDECSAQNEEGWKGRERSAEQAARLEAVERMLAGLRQPSRDVEPIEAGWDARRPQLIKDLEAERAELLKDQ
jgi:hypothetical protein